MCLHLSLLLLGHTFFSHVDKTFITISFLVSLSHQRQLEVFHWSKCDCKPLQVSRTLLHILWFSLIFSIFFDFLWFSSYSLIFSDFLHILWFSLIFSTFSDFLWFSPYSLIFSDFLWFFPYSLIFSDFLHIVWFSLSLIFTLLSTQNSKIYNLPSWLGL